MVDLNSEILSDLLLEAKTTLLTWGKLVRLKYQKLQNLQMKLNLHLKLLLWDKGGFFSLWMKQCL